MVFVSERMGKLFREVPISICFSDAVNLFSARAKFVRDGSQKSTVSKTTYLVSFIISTRFPSIEANLE
jgi:hypothetical protein